MTSRSRFAPSPTGLMHIGNARSAILNWAHITNKGGEFILRIDDTDFARSTKVYEQTIKDDLKWLGINWIKTFNQSERSNIYLKRINELKKSNRIYPCFDSLEELSLKRKRLLSMGKPPIYDRSALKLSEQQIKKNIEKGKNPHWRFKLDHKIVEWNDLIKGNIKFDCKNLSDPILIREDKTLLYHLPSVIDDIEENITDIIRGEDHINNTAIHIQIFNSLDFPIPIFGHHPFLIDVKGKGFSKRLGSISIKKLKEIGFESITLLNYLLTIGTSNNLSFEKNIDKIVKKFDIKALAKSSPKFSIKVLETLNKDIIKSFEFNEIQNKINELNIKNFTEDHWVFVKNNIQFFSDILSWFKIINSEEVYKTNDPDFLKIAAKLLPKEPFDITTWEKWTLEINKITLKAGKELYMPLRLALTGKEKGPELKYLIPLLKRKQILNKLGK